MKPEKDMQKERKYFQVEAKSLPNRLVAFLRSKQCDRWKKVAPECDSSPLRPVETARISSELSQHCEVAAA